MHKRTKNILIWSVTLLLLAALILVLYYTGFFQALSSQAALEAYIQACAPWSHLAYFGIQLVSVIVAPIPSNITALVGALVFGLWPAFLLTWAAVAAGSLAVFALARLLGKDTVTRFVGKKLSDRYLDVIRRKRDIFLFLAFLFPIFPDDLLCILAGLTDLPWKRFLLLCVIARPWGLFVACAVGSSALSIPLWAMALLAAAGFAVFLLAMKYGDKIEDALLARFRK